MRLLAAVPVKPLAEAKTRLGGSPEERATLVLRMLDRVLGALRAAPSVADVAVVSPDPAVLDHAARLGAFPILQRAGGLNDACRLGAEWARDADAILIVHGDLPALSPADVEAMAAMVDTEPVAVIAPDRRNEGTNALLLRPPGAIDFCFGPDSQRLHREAAARHDVAVRVHRARGTADDVDHPEDLATCLDLLLPAPR